MCAKAGRHFSGLGGILGCSVKCPKGPSQTPPRPHGALLHPGCSYCLCAQMRLQPEPLSPAPGQPVPLPPGRPSGCPLVPQTRPSSRTQKKTHRRKACRANSWDPGHKASRCPRKRPERRRRPLGGGWGGEESRGQHQPLLPPRRECVSVGLRSFFIPCAKLNLKSLM